MFFFFFVPYSTFYSNLSCTSLMSVLSLPEETQLWWGAAGKLQEFAFRPKGLAGPESA